MSAKIVNDLTGEVLLTGKSGRTYSLVFDLSAVMALEKITSKSAIDIMINPGATDCVAMIMCGASGWQRRNPTGPKINGNLAQKVFSDSGGLSIRNVLAESLSGAEGLGIGDEEEEEPDESDPGPLALPTS